jgi:hypothetical protein
MCHKGDGKFGTWYEGLMKLLFPTKINDKMERLLCCAVLCLLISLCVEPLFAICFELLAQCCSYDLMKSAISGRKFTYS